jgi:hypothetical protein
MAFRFACPSQLPRLNALMGLTLLIFTTLPMIDQFFRRGILTPEFRVEVNE